MEDKINQLQDKINYHRGAIDVLQNDINTLSARTLQEKINVLFDSGVLHGSGWMLLTSADSSFINIRCANRQIEKKINEIIKPNWGKESLTLQLGVILGFNDGDVSIGFINPKACEMFVNKNKIIVNVEQSAILINDLKTKIDIIETAVNSAKL